MPFRFIAFDAGRLPLGKDGKELPMRLKIAKWGTDTTQKGKVTCNATTAAVLIRNQDATKRRRVALDFQHNTVEGSPTYGGEPAKVAAFGDVEMVPGDGVYLSAIEWTPEGKDAALGGHYPDVSPAVKLNEQGEIIWVHSAGLVRQGEIDGLTLFSAADEIGSLIAQCTTDDPQTTDMDIKATRDLLNLFCGMAGVSIPETATIEEMQGLAKTGAAKLQAAIGTQQGKAAADEVTTLAASVKDLQTELAGLRKEQTAAKKAAIIAVASAAGKIIPFDAAQIEGMSVEVFSAIVDKLPAGQVPVEAIGGGKVTGGVVTFSAADREVMKSLGLTEEQWKKANQ